MKIPFFMYAFVQEHNRIKDYIAHLTDYPFKPVVIKNNPIDELVLRTTTQGNKVDFRLLTSLAYLHERGAITFSYEVSEHKVSYNILAVNRKLLGEIYAKPNQPAKKTPYEIGVLVSDVVTPQELLANRFNPYGIKQTFIDHELGIFQSVDFDKNNLAHGPNHVDSSSINQQLFDYCQSVVLTKVDNASRKNLLDQYCALFGVSAEAIKEDLYQQFCFVLYRYEVIGLYNYQPKFDGLSDEIQINGNMNIKNEPIRSPDQFKEYKASVPFDTFIREVTAKAQADWSNNTSFTYADVIKMEASSYSKLTIFSISKPLQSLSEIKMTAEKAKETVNRCMQTFHFYARSPNFYGAMTAVQAEEVLLEKLKENPKFHYLVRSSATSPDMITLSYIHPLNGCFHSRISLTLPNLRANAFGGWQLNFKWGECATVEIQYPKTFEEFMFRDHYFYQIKFSAHNSPSEENALGNVWQEVEVVTHPYEITQSITALFTEWEKESVDDCSLVNNNNVLGEIKKRSSVEESNQEEPVTKSPRAEGFSGNGNIGFHAPISNPSDSENNNNDNPPPPPTKGLQL